MRSYTVIGVLADELGHAYNPMERTRAWSTPASEFRSVQPAWIPIDRGHDHQWCGELVHLERANGNLWCIGQVDSEPTVAVKVGQDTVHVGTKLYWSAEGESRGGRDITLSSVAISAWPASVAARPLTWFPGDLAHRGSWQIDGRNLDEPLRGLITRAADARYRQGPLVIADRDQPRAWPSYRSADPGPPARDPGGLWLRHAETLDVCERSREIELLVVPYDTPALVGHKGRMVTETIAPGAFDDVAHQTNRIRVNRDHALERTVGRATEFDPADPRGLRATCRIAATPLGDETLELAADDCLDASAAFRPVGKDGMRWQDRDRYTIVAGWLGHIALVPDPAYEDAKVLAVRATPALS